MLEPVEQLAAAAARGVVQVDVLVPGGDEEPEGGGRELDGGNGVGRGVREFVLCCEGWSTFEVPQGMACRWSFYV